MDILELHNHLILKEGFKKHLEEENKPKVYTYPSNGYGYSSSYNADGTLARDRCNCKFYEWSNLNSTPKTFTRGKDFFEFLDKCKIGYTQKQKNDFNIYYNFFATCIQGKAELLLAKTELELASMLRDTL